MYHQLMLKHYSSQTVETLQVKSYRIYKIGTDINFGRKQCVYVVYLQSLQEDNRGSPRWSLTLYMSLLMAICLYLMIFTFSGKVSDVSTRPNTCILNNKWVNIIDKRTTVVWSWGPVSVVHRGGWRRSWCYTVRLYISMVSCLWKQRHLISLEPPTLLCLCLPIVS